MSLAQRLDQLAAAHAQALINDEDYRLLRQDLFHRFGSDSQPTTPRPPHQPSPAPPPPLPIPRKASVIENVANLLRRATGRSSLPHQSTPHTPPLRRKQSFLSRRRPDHNHNHNHNHNHHNHHQPQPQPQLQLQPEPEVQDQDDPSILRISIASAEAEYTRLREAFIALEASTLKRIEYKTARRLYTPTPTNVNDILGGREWRKHTKPVPSIILPPPPTPSTTDQHSIYSNTSSSRLSVTRSFSSVPQSPSSHRHPPQSPHSPHFRSPTSLRRQNSVSSASTQSTGTSSRLVIGPRSTGNLYLSRLAESTDTIADSRIASDDVDIDDPEAADYESAVQELNDIRRRREELDVRYLSRLDYLKAKLRTAELRERVLRR